MGSEMCIRDRDLFDGLIQTYVFVFLTSLFMKETMGDEE